MMENVYLTMQSRDHWRVINSLWAAIRLKNFLPQKVYLFGDDENMELAEKISLVLKEYGSRGEVRQVSVNIENFVDVTNSMMEIIKEEKRFRNRIAVDISGGRRTSVAGALLSAWNEEVHHAFYLYVDDENAEEGVMSASGPYMLIPISHQRIHDIIEEGEDAW